MKTEVYRKLLVFSFFVVFLVAFLFFGAGFILNKGVIKLSVAQIEDTEPPVIFDIQVSNISATSTTITWKTDELADSLIDYDIDKKYGIARDPLPDKQEHEIILVDLKPDTSYYFRITSVDVVGNQGISNDFVFITPKSEDSDIIGGYVNQGEGVDAEGTGDGYAFDVAETSIVQQAIDIIQNIKTEKSLEIIQENIKEKATEVAPLTIILNKPDVEVGTDYAVIRWSTNKDSNSMVELAHEDDFDEIFGQYSWQEGDPNELVVEHEVAINGLDPATIYHFRVYSQTSLSLEAGSNDHTFTTKSIKPEIYTISVTKVEEDSATISFVTNIPTKSLLEYTNLNLGISKLEGSNNFLRTHIIKLNNLIFDTYYSVVATVENRQNEKAISDVITFITTRDEYAPVITKIATESTLYPGSDNKVQTLVSWVTDEPAKCILYYQQGVISTDDAEFLPEEDDFTTKHVHVVTNFLPANVYKFWVNCKDDAENRAKSEDFTMLTPSREESIIDIILKNFESTFGWVKNLKM